MPGRTLSMETTLQKSPSAVICLSGIKKPQKQRKPDENETIDIDRLSNPYGKTKMMIEKIIKDCCMLNGFKAIILRFFNPIGTIAPLKINATYNKSNLEHAQGPS